MGEGRTKIVATVGPACGSAALIERMIQAGVDVFRLNFSHGEHDQHAAYVKMIREAADELETPVAIMQDLQGPRIRTGPLQGGKSVDLERGHQVVIESGDFAGTADRISTGYNYLAQDVSTGDAILINDGLIELEVSEVGESWVRCEVLEGGKLQEHQGMNLPGVDLSISAPTEKDLSDLAFAFEHELDYVALSFVRSATDLSRLQQEMDNYDAAPIPIVAKVERPEAVDELGEILKLAGGVMVARGDLGIEMPTEKVPGVQKRIIRAANEAAVPVITATQMLESMIENRRPTRAEASDVANAILDGTDAVMLSGETAIGQYPLESVRVMERIGRQTELDAPERPHRSGEGCEAMTRQQALASAARGVAERLNAEGIIAFTMTGATARYVSQQRPDNMIFALTPEKATYRRLALVWGVRPVMFPLFGSTDEMIERGEARLLDAGLASVGDTLVCMAGASTSTPGGTDMLKIHPFDGTNPYVEGDETSTGC